MTCGHLEGRARREGGEGARQGSAGVCVALANNAAAPQALRVNVTDMFSTSRWALLPSLRLIEHLANNDWYARRRHHPNFGDDNGNVLGRSEIVCKVEQVEILLFLPADEGAPAAALHATMGDVVRDERIGVQKLVRCDRFKSDLRPGRGVRGG